MKLIQVYIFALSLVCSLLPASSVFGQFSMQFVPHTAGKTGEEPIEIGSLDETILVATADNKKETIQLTWFSVDSLKSLLQKDFSYKDLAGENMVFAHGHTNIHGIQLYFIKTEGNQSELVIRNLTLGLEPAGPITSILKINSDNKKSDKHFGFDVSPGGAKCLAYKIPNGILDADTPLQIAVINEQGEVGFEKNLYLPFEKNVFDLNQFKIDDFGTVYMLSGLSMKKSAFASQNGVSRNETYVLLTYNHTFNKLKEYNIALTDKWVNAASVVIAPNNDAIVAGLFSNTMLPGSAGIFYMRIDHSNGAMVASSVSPFEKTLVNTFNEKASGREMEQLYLDFIHPTADGGLWLSGEQYFMTERTYLDPTYARPSTIYEYHFGNIVLVGLNAEGQTDFSAVIKKSQVTQNDGGRFSSYFLNATGRAPIICFFDHPKNTLDMTDRYRMVNAAKSELVGITVKDGALLRQSIINSNTIDLSVKEMQPIKEGISLEYGRLNREEGLILFQFDKDFWRK